MIDCMAVPASIMLSQLTLRIKSLSESKQRSIKSENNNKRTVTPAEQLQVASLLLHLKLQHLLQQLLP